MIQDLSRTLQSILTQPGLPAPLSNALIAFDRPEESFHPMQSTVDLFLYDLRENLELRNNELTIEKSGTTSVTHKAPMRLSCSYLAPRDRYQTEAKEKEFPPATRQRGYRERFPPIRRTSDRATDSVKDDAFTNHGVPSLSGPTHTLVRRRTGSAIPLAPRSPSPSGRGPG